MPRQFRDCKSPFRYPLKEMNEAVKLRIARIIFAAAAIYGVVVVLAMFFYPPAIFGKARWQQPELYYGFTTVTLGWQIVFLLIAGNPPKYRALMFIAAVFEKFAFVAVLIVLLLERRARSHWISPAVIDFVFGVLFLLARAFTPVVASGPAPSISVR